MRGGRGRGSWKILGLSCIKLYCHLILKINYFNINNTLVYYLCQMFYNRLIYSQLDRCVNSNRSATQALLR